MTSRSPLFCRPVPSLAEWIGDGARADGFEQWLSESLGAEGATEAEASGARLIKILAIACIEGCRIECDRHGRPAPETIALLARCAGVTVMCALLCLAADDAAGLPRLVRLLADEFRHGARQVALSVTRRRASEGGADR